MAVQDILKQLEKSNELLSVCATLKDIEDYQIKNQ